MSGNQLTHSSCFSEVNIQRYYCRSRLILSVCLSVWGWYAVDNLGWIPNLLQMSFITCEANCGPLSDTIPVGSPWCFHTWRKYSFAVSRLDTLLVQGMNSTSLENRSTTTRMLSNPSDSGRSMIKSADISFQGPDGVSSSFSFPGRAWLDPLKRAQRSHLDT